MPGAPRSKFHWSLDLTAFDGDKAEESGLVVEGHAERLELVVSRERQDKLPVLQVGRTLHRVVATGLGLHGDFRCRSICGLRSSSK
jgi:hypothetical protein